MAEITFGEAYGGAERGGAPRASVVHLVGGVVSLALIVGMGVWGAKIVMRDVTGVPVVRAMSDGPMRIAPENPGGDVATHAGLTVNTVAAEGEAAPPRDRLVLAPLAADLAAEDLEVAPDAEAGEVGPPARPDIVEAAARVDDGEAAAGADAPLSAEQVLELADRIAAAAGAGNLAEDKVGEAADDTTADAPVEVAEGATEGATEEEADIDPIEAAIAEAMAETPAPESNPDVDVISTAVPGVSRSLRPWARPAEARLFQASVEVAAAPGAAEIPVTAGLPAGTKLVQLGAYDTAELARTNWVRIAGRFDDYMAGKAPVIQQAETGGRTFYRLRASGFADLSAARRFCAVLMAENAACIPVVVR